jgi:hypothetical protein
MIRTQACTTSTPASSGNKITNHLPFGPKFEDIYGETVRLLVRIYEVMEKAVPQAKEFFVSGDEPVDTYLFNDLIRYHAKELLRDSGFAVEDDVEDVSEYEFRTLSNNGLFGRFNGHLFRILKADHGRVPMPMSGKRREFYTQPPQLPLPLNTPDKPGANASHNILILWEVDDQYNFLRLRLACPESVGRTRESLKVYFNEPLPHAAEMIKSKASAAAASEHAEDIQVTKK